MHPALWVSKTGLDAQQFDISVIANNLANVNTTGFKRGRAVFEDLLYQTVQQPGAQSSQNTQLPNGVMMGTGVRIVATQKMHGVGNISQTNNPLDVAITGKGFIQVLMPDGTINYTRDGAFQMDNKGHLVTSEGYVVQPAITIPAQTKSITIGNDGTISALVSGTTDPVQVGQLQLSMFMNDAGLQPQGGNLYTETASSGSPSQVTPGANGSGYLSQGSLEASNVNVVEELVNMIESQRAYEMNAKAIQTVDGMLQFASQVL